MIESIMGQAVFLYKSFDNNMSEWRERIKADWQKTFKMPRKKKKRVRKELKLDWVIANYDPFNF